ncbi:MAG: peptidoglycan-binding protein [Acetobacteraceae bacterium]
MLAALVLPVCATASPWYLGTYKGAACVPLENLDLSTPEQLLSQYRAQGSAITLDSQHSVASGPNGAILRYFGQKPGDAQRTATFFSRLSTCQEAEHVYAAAGPPNSAPPVATPASASTVGPSFDCKKAAEPLAQVICASPALSKLDLEFAQAYFALRQQVGPDGQSAAVQEAIDFTAGVVQTCQLPNSGPPPPASPSLVACIEGEYQRRRDAWITLLSEPAKEEATRPVEQHIALQQDLQTLGFLPASARIDGVYGAETRTAIVAWQQAQGESPTGFLDDADAAILARSATGKAGGSGSGAAETSVAVAPSASVQPPTPTPATIAASDNSAGAVLGSWSGEGQRNTTPFDAPGPWELRWCSSDSDPIIGIYTASGDVVGEASGAPAGQSYEPESGDFYLSVDVDGPWQIEAVPFSSQTAKASPCSPAAPASEASPQAEERELAVSAPTSPEPLALPTTSASLPPQPAGKNAEAWLVKTTGAFDAGYVAANNPMARGVVRHDRASALCGAESPIEAAKGVVSGWTGTIESLDTVGDGRGILSVRIAPHLTLSTDNNQLSESLASFKTLIPIGSAVYDAAMHLKPGQTIVFAGIFHLSGDDCMEEQSLTGDGSMAHPDFLFRFTSLAPTPSESDMTAAPDTSSSSAPGTPRASANKTNE